MGDGEADGPRRGPIQARAPWHTPPPMPASAAQARGWALALLALAALGLAFALGHWAARPAERGAARERDVTLMVDPSAVRLLPDASLRLEPLPPMSSASAP